MGRVEAHAYRLLRTMTREKMQQPELRQRQAASHLAHATQAGLESKDPCQVEVRPKTTPQSPNDRGLNPVREDLARCTKTSTFTECNPSLTSTPIERDQRSFARYSTARQGLERESLQRQQGYLSAPFSMPCRT